MVANSSSSQQNTISNRNSTTKESGSPVVPRLPSPPLESNRASPSLAISTTNVSPGQAMRFLSEVALPGFPVPPRPSSRQRRTSIKLPPISTLTGATPRPLSRPSSSTDSDVAAAGGLSASAGASATSIKGGPRWEYASTRAAPGGSGQPKIVLGSPAEGVAPNRPVRHASPSLLRAESRTEPRIASAYRQLHTPVQESSSSSNRLYDARGGGAAATQPQRPHTSTDYRGGRVSPAPPDWQTPPPYDTQGRGGASAASAQFGPTQGINGGGAGSGSVSAGGGGSAGPVGGPGRPTQTVFYDGLPSPAYENNLPMPPTHGYEHSNRGGAQNDAPPGRRHNPASSTSHTAGHVRAADAASRHHYDGGAPRILARPQILSYAAASAIHPSPVSSEPPARGYDPRRHGILQPLWTVDAGAAGRRDVPWRETQFDPSRDAAQPRGRKREREHDRDGARVPSSQSPVRRSRVPVMHSSASTPVHRPLPLPESMQDRDGGVVGHRHSNLGLFEVAGDEASSQIDDDDSDNRHDDSSEEEYTPNGKRRLSRHSASGTRASQRLRGRDSMPPNTNGLGIVTGPAARKDVKPVSPESACAVPLGDELDGRDGTPAPTDSKPQKRTYVRRDAQRRKEQNAQAQRKFRYKKKAMAEQMRLDLEEQRKLVDELRSKYDALDAALAEAQGELAKVRAENRALKRRLEECRTPDDDPPTTAAESGLRRPVDAL